MLKLVNKERRSMRMNALFMQNDLRVVARKHSRDMARKDYFEHENFEGKTHADRLVDAKVSDVVSGENLAKIGGYKQPVFKAHIGLMNSPGHRANILNTNYNCVGIGVVKSNKKIFYYTQNFAKRDLLILNSPRTKLKRNRTWTMKFRPTTKLKVGLYRVIENEKIIREHSFLIHKNHNKLEILFSKSGEYKINIFVGESAKGSLSLSNSFKLHVKPGWF